MLNKLKLRTKIVLLIVVSLIGMVGLTAFAVLEMRQDLMDARKIQIRSVTEALFNTVSDFHAQEKAGKLTRAEAQKGALEAARTARYGGKDGKTEYFYVYTMGGINLFHIRAEFVGQDLREKIRDGQGRYPVKDLLAALQAQPAAFVDSFFPRPGEQIPVEKLQFVMHFEPWGWMLGTGVYVDDVQKEFLDRLLYSVSISALVLVVMSLFGFVVARGVLRQVGGEPDDAIRLMSRVSGGDLTAEIDNVPEGSMLHSMREMIASLRHMVAAIGECSSMLMGDADRISTASRDVAAASARQSDATSSMAAAIEEMTVSINHISESAKDSQDNSLVSVGLSEEGFRKIQSASDEINQIATRVDEASGRIRKLEERANQISSIAGVIKEIAAQTNLLALNAAIEAARAGEQGRGFAVVADEVRKLAERTSMATIEIEQMIMGIQSDTVEVVSVMDAALPQVAAGVSAAQQAADSLLKIQESAQATLERVREVADSTKEQSNASDSIARRVEEVAAMVDETASAMTMTADTAADMQKISTDLSGMVKRFRC